MYGCPLSISVRICSYECFVDLVRLVKSEQTRPNFFLILNLPLMAENLQHYNAATWCTCNRMKLTVLGKWNVTRSVLLHMEWHFKLSHINSFELGKFTQTHMQLKAWSWDHHNWRGRMD